MYISIKLQRSVLNQFSHFIILFQDILEKFFHTTNGMKKTAANYENAQDAKTPNLNSLPHLLAKSGTCHAPCMA